MKFHFPTSTNVKNNEVLTIVKSGRTIHSDELYKQSDYPTLSNDIVKIVARDGSNIFIPINKLANNSR